MCSLLLVVHDLHFIESKTKSVANCLCRANVVIPSSNARDEIPRNKDYKKNYNKMLGGKKPNYVANSQIVTLHVKCADEELA